ncbi:hypothetical protein NE237_022087 [Protea cynaroides]|uniref:rhamnogalacturonan endolyase n=1 Tax=Protea cynaroides TaxID=273540 RepID=A0A9Q0K5G6_9MAGN|nr:hypothetical protein NE237_022087 [Protea cynaroides]
MSWSQSSLLCLGLLLQLSLLADCSLKSEWTRNIPRRINAEAPAPSSGLRLQIEQRYVVMDNGLLQVTLSKPQGFVTNIKYNGIDNLLEHRNKEENRGFVMLPGCSGFYSYAIYEHLEGWPDFNMDETRIVFKLRQDLFHYMAISDQRQRIMPKPEDRETGEPLAYHEAVILTNPINPELKGEVDDKYQYSCENQDCRVHGWISSDPPVGFWMINPSIEFRTGGPVKQDLTSHVGPTTLSMFVSLHYSGEDLSMSIRDGEHWKKVFGPVFIYLNSASAEGHVTKLWDDAKQQLLTEVQNWPYSFPASDDFPYLDQRGTVTGRLFIQDRFLHKDNIPAESAYLGLAAPGDIGSWQTESKGYQFWTRANSDGFFSINGARPGNYNLYGWVPGFLGDYKYRLSVRITPGCKVNLGDLIYEPSRQGPTLWEIGIPDHSAAEFYMPDPNPKYINKLYVGKTTSNDSVHVDKFRHYGLWERYSELYLHEDQVYTVGTSDYSKDWFFAHVLRRNDDNTYKATTWQIRFNIDNVTRVPNETQMLRVAIASATRSKLQIVYMKKMSWSQSSLLCLGLLLQLSLLADCSLKSESTRDIPPRINGDVPASSSGLRLQIEQRYVVMDNGPLQVTLSKPQGIVTNIKYNGIDNLLEPRNEEENRGYWDIFWNPPDVRKGKREKFVMLPGPSGFYTYAIYEHLEGWPDFNMDNTRIAFKLRRDLFHYMAISDQRQRIMPMPEDRATGEPLAYPEAVILTNPINPELKGEVDDKYQYSCENQDCRVHGWISSDPPVGFWMINPSIEFRTGGPVKQDLTSHVGPTTLSVFVSLHYSGKDLSMSIRDGEHWKKVFGPVFIYLNSAPAEGHVTKLWDDAKQQLLTEVQNWPYSFPASSDFLSSDQRGTVTGRLFIQDRFLYKDNIPANLAYLGLAAPGDIGSWQTESKGYQFWTRANSDGSFSINGVRPGRYNLYGWVPGFLGDYKYGLTVTITPGSKVNLGDLIYEPPRQGPTLWEIGIPDRSAAEFYVPDPNPKYINKLYVANTTSNDTVPVDKFRQYGLWERYAELYPHEDLVYTIGTSDYSKDWFFAHVDRRNDDNTTYKATTWQIRFNLDNVTTVPNETHVLRVAIASATGSQLLGASSECRRTCPSMPVPPVWAGITVFSPMKYYGLCTPGIHLGVAGLGRLGHVAVKFAKAFGMKVTLISINLSKKQEAP